MKVQVTVVGILCSAAAYGGDTPAGPTMQSPVGSVIMPTAAASRDIFSLGGEVIVFGLAAQVAKLNRHAKLRGGNCMAHVRAVRDLAPEWLKGREYSVQLVISSATIPTAERHASALVTVGERVFLLDNGALGIPHAGDWLEATELDRSGWLVEGVP